MDRSEDHQNDALNVSSTADDFIAAPGEFKSGDDVAANTSNPPAKEETDPGLSRYTANIKEGPSDEATTQQIIRFWNHPSLQQVPIDQKQAYLKHKGITEEQIFNAWDKIIEAQTAPAKGDDAKPQPKNSVPTPTAPNQQQPPQQSYGHPPQIPNPPQDAHFHPNSTYHYPPHTQTPQHDDFVEDDYATPNLALVATLGGFLGLLAAAAVRWLNGGDFLLFPPPSRANQERELILNQRQQQSAVAENAIETSAEEDNDSEEEDDDEEDDDDAELEQYLSSHNTTTLPKEESDSQKIQQAIAQLTDTFQQHVMVQQRILQKITTTTNASSVTDLSMQALRNHHKENQKQSTTTKVLDPMVWYKLVEIQVELASLKREWQGSKNGPEIEKRLDETLQKLQAILDEHWKPPKEESIISEKSMDKTDENSSPLPEAKYANLSQDIKALTEGSKVEDKREDKVEARELADESTTEDEKKEDTTGTSPKSPPPPEVGDLQASESPAEPAAESVDSDQVAPEPAADPKNDILRCVRTCIINLVRKNTGDLKMLKEGTQILYLYMINLSKNPHVPKYRKVFTSNQSFKKVDQLQGAKKLLSAVGFVASEDNRVLEWPPMTGQNEGWKDLTAEDKDKLVQSYFLPEVAAALAILKSIKGTETEETEVFSLLEKALDLLPCPP